MTYDWPLIFSYHHLHPTRSSRYVVDAGRFERDLAGLLDRGFTALSLAEAIATGPFGDGSAPAKTFCVTFDDALESFATIGLPVLNRLGIVDKTTLFVPTAHVGGENAWRTEPTLLQRLMPWGEVAERILGWDRITEVASAGVSIESHGHAHLPMQRLDYEGSLQDVSTSMRLLKEHGATPRYFALPYGWHSEECKRAIADAGFDAALSVKWGGKDRFEIRRIPVYGTDSSFTTRLKHSGRYFDAFDAAARLAGKKRYRR